MIFFGIYFGITILLLLWACLWAGFNDDARYLEFDSILICCVFWPFFITYLIGKLIAKVMGR